MAEDRQKKLYDSKPKAKPKPSGEGDAAPAQDTVHTRHARERADANGRHAKERDDHHKRVQKELEELAARQEAEMLAEAGPTPRPAGPVTPAAGTAPAAQQIPVPAAA